MYKRINRCRVCGNERLVPVLDLGRQALTSIFPRQRNQEIPVAPLTLVKCHSEDPGSSCGLLQLRDSFDPRAIYAGHYGYRSGLNESMVRHLQGHVSRILGMVPLREGDVVLDIGSNDGTLLAAYPKDKFFLAGIDPAGEKFRPYYRRDIKLVPEFFSADCARHLPGKAKVITSIAMFYDVESPLDFMRQVRELLDEDGIWIFEQSYLPAMLKKNAYDTICHEHLEYYGLRQIKWMADRAGLKIVNVEFNEVNGGSFCVTAAKQGSPWPEDALLVSRILDEEESSGLNTLEPYREFERRIYGHRRRLLKFIRQIRSRHKTIIGYGASTKGNVLLQFCGLTDREIACIAEVNEEKHGCFCPGTRIPIISEEEARRKHPDYFFVLPWHFKSNFIKREKDFLAKGGKFLMPLPDIETVF